MAARLCVAVLALVVAGCGAAPPDLFEVTRTGADRNANVTLLVSDGGSVECNGQEHALDAKRLLAARELARDLIPQAELGLELPAGAGTQLTYAVRLEQGRIGFSDRSSDMPQTFNRVVAFTADVVERVCGIER